MFIWQVRIKYSSTLQRREERIKLQCQFQQTYSVFSALAWNKIRAPRFQKHIQPASIKQTKEGHGFTSHHFLKFYHQALSKVNLRGHL